jgi:glutamate synthase (NADPH/NADH) small chain
MGKVTGFMEWGRKGPPKEAIPERLGHFRELERRLPVVQATEQAGRCMACGVPFCHQACPLGNAIPDWNDRVFRGDTAAAIRALEATNNFPEITGRVCPAPCEEACVLRIDVRGAPPDPMNAAPVTIRAIEREIAERHFEAGLVPRLAERKTGKKVIVVGSGPAGLAAAQELARLGHEVEVLERDAKVGGLLRYGIPDFKLEKSVIDRRLEQMRSEGVVFRTGVEVGKDESLAHLRFRSDAVVLATGASLARELQVPGRELGGIHLAMPYLSAQNRVVSGELAATPIDARGRDVVILGGGDTGSDCLGTALRQGARSVTQIELLAKLPEGTNAATPWPLWQAIHRTSSSQEEGGLREFALKTKRFVGEREVTGLEVVDVERVDGALVERPGSERVIPASLVLLALGFVGPEPALLGELERDARSNVQADTRSWATSEPGVFACGDARRGQSLVVWAIWEGRECARAVDAFLGQPLGATRQPQRWELPRS